jgi:hypothetical protein
MANDFTPGPWYLTGEDDRRYIREEASDACIALMLDGGHVDPKFAMPEKEIAANARLISAAPRLYELLERALWALDKSGGIWGGEDAARALLAEISGEQVQA